MYQNIYNANSDESERCSGLNKKYAICVIALVLLAAFVVLGSSISNPSKESDREKVQNCTKKEGVDCTSIIHEFQERWGENP